MNTLESKLKIDVMRRVHFIYWAKRVYHSVTLKVFLLGICMAFTTLSVSLPHILLNMPSLRDVVAVWKFLMAAFVNTQMNVQLLSLLALAVLVWLTRDIVRTIRGEAFASRRVRI